MVRCSLNIFLGGECYAVCFGNFTKFVKGSKPHLASVCFRIDFIDSTWNRRCFLLQLRSKILHGLLTIYIWIMRGTPLLLQFIFIYYVLPSIGIRIDRLPAAITAFTLNYAAYFAEIFRGGIVAIPTGQYEAAKVLKLSSWQTIRYIILPQVVKIVLPSVFNEVMSLIKDTSLVYALGISDLILASRTAANRDASLAPMFLAGAIFLILIGIVTIIAKRVEKNFSYYK